MRHRFASAKAFAAAANRVTARFAFAVAAAHARASSEPLSNSQPASARFTIASTAAANPSGSVLPVATASTARDSRASAFAASDARPST